MLRGVNANVQTPQSLCCIHSQSIEVEEHSDQKLDLYQSRMRQSPQKYGTGSISARSHSFVEIYHEIISMVILLPSAESFKKGCSHLQGKVCARSTGQPLVQACP